MTDTTIYNILEDNGFVFIRPYVQLNREWGVLAYVGGGPSYENIGCTLMEKDNVEIGTAWGEDDLKDIIQEIKRDKQIKDLLE